MTAAPASAITYIHEPGPWTSDDALAIAVNGLRGRGHVVTVHPVEQLWEWMASAGWTRSFLCFVPASLSSLSHLADIAVEQQLPQHFRPSFKGVLGPTGPTTLYDSTGWRRSFARLGAAGFHVAHAEIRGTQLYWDPARVADFLFSTTLDHIRFGLECVSDDISDVTPGEVVEFRVAIADMYGARLFDGLTDGAIAMRRADGSLMVNATKSPKHPSSFSYQDIVVVEGRNGATNTVRFRGHRAPTSGIVWYWELFARRPDVRTMVHAHTRHLTHSGAAAVADVTTPRFAPYGGTTGLPEVLKILERSPIAVMRAHGPIAIGDQFADGIDTIVALRAAASPSYQGPP